MTGKLPPENVYEVSTVPLQEVPVPVQGQMVPTYSDMYIPQQQSQYMAPSGMSSMM